MFSFVASHSLRAKAFADTYEHEKDEEEEAEKSYKLMRWQKHELTEVNFNSDDINWTIASKRTHEWILAANVIVHSACTVRKANAVFLSTLSARQQFYFHFGIVDVAPSLRRSRSIAFVCTDTRHAMSFGCNKFSFWLHVLCRLIHNCDCKRDVR